MIPLAAQVPDFVGKVYPFLDKAGCKGCHNENGVASASRLIFPGDGAGADEILRAGMGMRKLVRRERPEESLLVLKPTNRVAHAGGERDPRGRRRCGHGRGIWLPCPRVLGSGRRRRGR